MNKKQLEIIISKLKPIQTPKPSLEQYTIPSDLAAEILNLAHLRNDIEDKVVFDFGCGTGRLALGALLLGAKEVVAVDTDDTVLETAEENFHSLVTGMKGISFNGSIKFVCSDIGEFEGKCDTVVQNPPFGIQGSHHADSVFLEKALECGRSIYSLHKNGYEKTQEFLTRLVESKGGKVEQIVPYTFSIPHMFKFHDKPKKEISVDLYVIRK
ncbi:MAG: 50S ribosomal protein L11 methyltransferase [Candidatus Aenigmarchaeota archaeon]|nr:50S ribosomal protein L11 methyltransferase [Candidatus Aenigmarchaeota archaeon]